MVSKHFHTSCSSYAMHHRNSLARYGGVYYTEMKLGDPPKNFYFHIDTGSRHSWVYCKVSGHQSNLDNLVSHLEILL